MKRPALDSARGVDSLQGGRDVLRQIMKKAKPLDIEVMVDGKPLPGGILSIEIMNIVYTGPGLPLSPGADPGDRMLDVICVRRDDRKAMSSWIKEPQHRRPPGTMKRGRRVDIVWRGEPLRIDDDVMEPPKGETTITVMLAASTARILVPPPRGLQKLWQDWS
jgi:diacylglycerol kinase (ATP)